uniref:Dol-P-Glc:Glc(2)Man(9)GlcNAc(2)-PP-Dol alpha-1,2-glucosyltransferase n=1 Tax=Panagrellus redivivus TaxID=6233 RepID=A0A7E4VE71_PANRE
MKSALWRLTTAVIDFPRVVALAGILSLLHAKLVEFTYDRVPDAYMDEVFHLNQTRAYCDGDYKYWNNMITTPPALYLLTPRFLCHGHERYINSFLWGLCFLGLVRYRKKLFPRSNVAEAILTSMVVSILPVLFDTSILYYTDLLSLTAVIWGLSTANPKISVAFFAVAVVTRQTNILWAGLYVAHGLNSIFNLQRPFYSLWKVIQKYATFVILALLFVLFVVFNEGIVLGDRTAHEPVLHLPQVWYLLAFIAFSAWPVLLFDIFHIKSRLIRYWFITAALIAAIFASVSCCTIAHKYLLADNRHFTFYIWRRWFAKYSWAPLASGFIYIIAVFGIIPKLNQKLGPFLTLATSLATAACLIPAPLLEFRYFIIPYALWRISLPEHRRSVLVLELFSHVVVNLAALYLFFEKPFTWSNHPGETQRFMW